jgi:hypothetical protein
MSQPDRTRTQMVMCQQTSTANQPASTWYGSQARWHCGGSGGLYSVKIQTSPPYRALQNNQTRRGHHEMQGASRPATGDGRANCHESKPTAKPGSCETTHHRLINGCTEKTQPVTLYRTTRQQPAKTGSAVCLCLARCEPEHNTVCA